jgi:integrase
VRTDWETRRVVDVTTGEVEAWVSHLTSLGSGVTTVRRAHAVLSGIFADAVKARRLVSNPAAGVDNLPRRVQRRHIYLTASDVHRLAVQVGEHRALVLVLASCGLRWGEAIALRVSDVDFLRRRILVSINAVQLGSTHHVGLEGPPLTINTDTRIRSSGPVAAEPRRGIEVIEGRRCLLAVQSLQDRIVLSPILAGASTQRGHDRDSSPPC